MIAVPGIDELTRIVEALLMASTHPLTIDDLVETLQQVRFSTRINLKIVHGPVRCSHRLRFQVDSKDMVRSACLSSKILNHVDGKLDEENAVLETVIMKNVRKAWSDYTGYSLVCQRPRRVLT